MPSRVILITGAAGGIGSATARIAVERGHRVALVDVDAAGLDRVAAPLADRALAIDGDVTDAVAMKRAVATTLERFGRVDAVVANAGIEILGPVETMPDVDVERIVDVDLLGVWRTVRAALPEIRRRHGYVAVVTSASGASPGPFNAAYNAAKAGVVAFARTLRLEVRRDRVAVGIVWFGYVDTATARRSVEHPAMRPILARAPQALREPVPVDRAASAIVGAVERRARRVVAPGSMTPSVLLPELAGAITERFLRGADVRCPDDGAAGDADDID